MPIVDINGVGKIDFADTMSHEDITRAIETDIVPRFKQMAAEKEKASGFGAGFKSGLEGLRGAYYGAKYGLTGDEADRQSLLESQAKQEKLYQGPGWEETKQAFADKGILSGLGTAASAAAGTLGQSLPYMAAPVAAAALAPEAAIAGVGLGTLGFLGTSAAQYTGQNVGRQVQEQEAAIKRGETPQELSLGKAALASVPAAVLDRFALGKTFQGTGLGKLFGQEGKEGAEAIARKIVETGGNPSKIGSILKGGARGIGAEIPNEVGQQILERAQAGLDLTSDDAIREYKEAAFGATMLGGGFGGVSGMGMRSAGMKTAAGWEARAADETAAFDKKEAERLKAMETTKTSILDTIRAANEKEAQRLQWQGDIREVGSAALDRSLGMFDTPEGIDTMMGNMEEYFPGMPKKDLAQYKIQLRTYKQRLMAQQKADAARAQESAFTQETPDVFGEFRPAPTIQEAIERPEFQLEAQTPSPQMGLDLGEPQPPAAPTEPAKIDDKYLRGFGLDKRSATYKALMGKDLNNPTDVAEVRNIINGVLEGKATNTQAKVDQMLRTDTRLQEQQELTGLQTEAELDNIQAEAAREKRNQGLAQLLATLETENAAKEEAVQAATGQPSAGVPSEAGVQNQPVGPEPSVDVYDTTGGRGTAKDRGIGGGALGLTGQAAQERVEDAGEAGNTLDFAQMMAEAEAEADRQIAAERAAKEQAAPAAPQTQADFESLLAAEGMPAELGAEEGFEEIPVEYETDEQERERRAQEKAEYDELYGPLKFSEGRPEGASSDAADVTARLKKAFAMPARFGDLVNVVQSADELPDVAKQELSQAKDPSKVQAFVGNDGKVHLIADNITPGEEMGVFLHELGAHVGMEGLIGPANVRALTAQIMKWGDSGANTLEAQIAQRALARAEQSSSQDKSDEAIAYFVEEAVKAGVDPVAVQELNNPLGRWFRKLWAATKVGLRKLGMGKIDKLTAQNIVDLAYGAAHLELSGAWHGTAADFRKFNHQYMGTGEGAQVYGWGSYLAQRPGIAHGYWRADTGRKASAKIKVGDKTFDFGTDGYSDALANEFHKALLKEFPNADMDALEYVESGLLEGGSKTSMLKSLAGQTHEKANNIRKILNALETSEKPEGNLMRVSFNANDLELLDWDTNPNWYVLDKLQSGMPEHIQKALEDEVGPPMDLMHGGELYNGLKMLEYRSNSLINLLDPKDAKRIDAKYRNNKNPNAEMARAEEVTSTYLDSLGVKGTRYLDAESRMTPKEREEYIQTYTLLLNTLEDAIPDLKQKAKQTENGPKWNHHEAKLALDTALNRQAQIKNDLKELQDFKPTRNVVVFNDKNIVRAVSYKGAKKSNVKFSEATKRADELLEKAGRSVKQAEESAPFLQTKIDQAKEIAAAPAKWRDLVETMVFSADAKINNEIRRALMDKLEAGGEEAHDALAKLYSISTSQALHNEAVAHQFIEQGNVEYNPELFKFEVKKDDNSWANMIQELKKLADQHGSTFGQMEAYAQTALEARRLKGINEFNAKIEKEAELLESKGKKQRAKQHREKLKFSHMTDEQIAAGNELFKEIPGLNKIVDMWNGIRKNAMKVAVDSGLFSQERAEDLLEIMDYVPFYRVEQLEAKAGPKEFSRGLLDAARDYRFKGSEQEVNNLFDNMERWASYMVRRAVNNKTAQNLVQVSQEVLKEAKEVPKAQRGMEANTIAIWQNGERKFYEFSDPLFVKAFTGLEPVALPAFKALSKFSNALRKNIVLNPLFSVSQLSQDSFAAMLTSGLKQPFKLPLEVMKEFVKTLRGTSEAHEALKAVGAAGVRDYSATISRLDAEMAAGLKAPTTWQKLLSPLEKFSMASDNAVRQAIYNMTMKETGGDKAKAIERAFEIINFRRKGASGTLAIAGQVIPFFNAYLQAQNVAYKVLTGRGVSPTARKEARNILAANTVKIMALAMMYAAVMSDDDDYKKLDPTIRDRHWIIPGTGLMLPTRTDLFSMPKIIAEHTYNLMTDQGFEDGTKAKRAMKDAIVNAITGPTPVPQAFKPLVEVVLNRNFYTGRPIVGRGIENLQTSEQFTASTSEFAKAIGSTGIIAPVNVDHLIRGYLGTTGGLTLMAMDSAINSASGVPTPSRSMQDVLASTPGLSTFVTKEFGGAAKTDFYELKGMVDEVSATVNRLQKTGRAQEAKELLAEEGTKELLKVKNQVNQIQSQLSKLRERENLIRALPETRMTADQKETEIRKIRETEQRMLANVSKLRKIAGL